GQVSSDKNQPYWIGLHDRIGEDNFQWLDDTAKVTYFNWGQGQPNNIPSATSRDGQDCVEIGSSFVAASQWNDNACSDTAKYICEKSLGGSSAQATCPNGWIESPGSGTCIKLSDDKKSWADARAACQADGGDLVKILDDSMNQFIWGQVSSDRNQPYWIGLHDRIGEDDFQWLDDTAKVTYFNWGQGQPNNIRRVDSLDGQDCVEIGSSFAPAGQWNDNACTDTAKYICEKSLGGSSAQATCPNGWIESPGSGTCIKLSDDKKSWADARAACQADGGDLVKILDDSMNQFIWGQVSSDRNQPYWIGLHDRIGEDDFQWLDDTAKVTYFNWGQGQPNNIRRVGSLDGQDCVEIGSSFAPAGQWNDNACSDTAKYICEKSLGGSSSKAPSDQDWTTKVTDKITNQDWTTTVTSKVTTIDQHVEEEKTTPGLTPQYPTKKASLPSSTVTEASKQKSAGHTANKEQGAEGLDGGSIAAIVIGTLVLCVLLVGAAFFGRRYYITYQANRMKHLNSAIEFTNQMYASMQEMTTVTTDKQVTTMAQTHKTLENYVMPFGQ
ncbi:hypothetical protein EGW08_000505, partial [Elysia chlorotica]